MEKVRKLLRWLENHEQSCCAANKIDKFYKECHVARFNQGLKKLCKDYEKFLRFDTHKFGGAAITALMTEEEFMASQEFIDYQLSTVSAQQNKMSATPVDPAFEDVWRNQPTIEQWTIEKALKEPTLVGSTYTYECPILSLLMREQEKRRSEEAFNELLADSTALTKYLTEIKNVEDECTFLSNLATTLNISVTHLCVALATKPYIDHQKGTSQLTVPEEERCPVKTTIAKHAARLARNDYLFGYLVNAEVQSSLNDAGAKGESILLKNLKTLGIPPSDYLTEEDQKATRSADDKAPTPDILFKKPIEIYGQAVNWIECKNSVIIPEISTHRQLESLRKQTISYRKAYGPGAILWTKIGYSDSIKSFLSPKANPSVPQPADGAEESPVVINQVEMSADTCTEDEDVSVEEVLAPLLHLTVIKAAGASTSKKGRSGRSFHCQTYQNPVVSRLSLDRYPELLGLGIYDEGPIVRDFPRAELLPPQSSNRGGVHTLFNSGYFSAGKPVYPIRFVRQQGHSLQDHSNEVERYSREDVDTFCANWTGNSQNDLVDGGTVAAATGLNVKIKLNQEMCTFGPNYTVAHLYQKAFNCLPAASNIVLHTMAVPHRNLMELGATLEQEQLQNSKVGIKVV